LDEAKQTDASAEGESDQEGSKGAYDPVTGEINWDCPCLGGMAHGPCGPEFREAFSCFVFSEEEPKGINCVEKFMGMQTCFRAHPDVYGEGKFWFNSTCFSRLNLLSRN
jgi:intermembrane space import and assembly protein 40